MSMVTLGSTGICVNKNGFGALPVQRVTKEDAVYLLRNVYEDKNDFWHGGVPYNCAVSIIEVQNGVSTLLADNKIYYDPSDCVNFYKEVK